MLVSSGVWFIVMGIKQAWEFLVLVEESGMERIRLVVVRSVVEVLEFI